MSVYREKLLSANKKLISYFRLYLVFNVLSRLKHDGQIPTILTVFSLDNYCVLREGFFLCLLLPSKRYLSEKVAVKCYVNELKWAVCFEWQKERPAGVATLSFWEFQTNCSTDRSVPAISLVFTLKILNIVLSFLSLMKSMIIVRKYH